MLAYDRTGSGEPLLLIHGISHRRQAWQPVMAQLAEHYDVIAVDLPGHGESPAFDPQGRPVGEAITAEIADFLAEIGVERPHVVGNSLGALIALELGEAGLARSVTAFAPAGFWFGPLDFCYVRGLFAGIQAAARRLEPVAPRLLRSAAGRAVLFGWATAHPSRIDPDAGLGDLENMIESRAAIATMFTGAYVYTPRDLGRADHDGVVASGVRRVRWQGGGGSEAGGLATDDNAASVRAGGRAAGAHRGQHAPTMPVTIAWGTRDTVLLPYHALRARKVLPQATHVWLPSCGHIPMSDDPALVVSTIRAATLAQVSDTRCPI